MRIMLGFFGGEELIDLIVMLGRKCYNVESIWIRRRANGYFR